MGFGIENLLSVHARDEERFKQVNPKIPLDVELGKESLQTTVTRVEGMINDRLSPTPFGRGGERGEIFTSADGTEYRMRQRDIGKGAIYTWIAILRKPKTDNPAHNLTPDHVEIYFENNGAICVKEGTSETLNTMTSDYKSNPGDEIRAQKALGELKLFEQELTTHEKLQQSTLQ